jgi:predicted acetyltransferase
MNIWIRIRSSRCHRSCIHRWLTTGGSGSTEWRKSQLDKLEQSFASTIENDEQIQPMWKDMESRVTRRKSFTVEERKGVIGRRNVRKTDEDNWLQAGLYGTNNEQEDNATGSKENK